MNTSIDTSEHYALVSSKEFTQRMDQRWSQGLHLSSSPALRTLWGIMADTFRTATVNSINGVVASPWLILQPPTGSGKTRGTCVFAAMQADANAQGALKPVGVLIVTRLIAQVEQMTKEINELAGRTVAVAHHSDKPATEEELLGSDILIITCPGSAPVRQN
jgi:Rad3-related DNA helicase